MEYTQNRGNSQQTSRGKLLENNKKMENNLNGKDSQQNRVSQMKKVYKTLEDTRMGNAG